MKKKWGKYDEKAISETFNLINEEIAIFNNDLNQVSYQLHPIFIGEIYMFAINQIWKL